MILDADKLKRTRKLAGLTQEQLAQAMGVSRQAVSHWENGHSLPDEATLLRLARVLRTAPEQLSPDSPESPMEEPAASPAPAVKKQPMRLICVALAALLLALGLWCLLRPRGFSSSMRPQDFQQSQVNACLILSPMDSNLLSRQAPYGKERFWRLNVYLQASMDGDCTVQELRYYRYGRDWLGRITLREVLSHSVSQLRSIWGTNVARAGQAMNYITSASVEADDYGFGIEAVGRSGQGQPYAVRTWMNCAPSQ